MTSLLRKGSSSDYISIKKQTTISTTESNNQGAKTLKTNFVTMMGNYHFLVDNNPSSTLKSLQNSASYDLLYSYRQGQQKCCDITNNLALV
jgi:hypothetical protein